MTNLPGGRGSADRILFSNYQKFLENLCDCPPVCIHILEEQRNLNKLLEQSIQWPVLMPYAVVLNDAINEVLQERMWG